MEQVLPTPSLTPLLKTVNIPSFFDNNGSRGVCHDGNNRGRRSLTMKIKYPGISALKTVFCRFLCIKATRVTAEPQNIGYFRQQRAETVRRYIKRYQI